MNAGKTLFAQVMEFVPWTSFTRIVDRYAGNAGVIEVGAGAEHVALCRCQKPFRAAHRRLVHRRINLEQEVALPDEIALLHAQLGDPALDVREDVDLGVGFDFAAGRF